MPTTIDIKYGTENGKFSLEMVQNIIIQKKELKLTYIVIADNTTQDSTVIKTTVGIPALGSLLYGMICQSVDPRNTDTVVHPVTGVLTCLWEVDVTFNTMIRPPTDTNPKVTWTGELGSEHQEFDLITLQKITTTADEPLFLERPVPYQIVTIRRLEEYPFNDIVPLLYVGKVNSAPFYHRPPGSGMMLPIETEEDTVGTQRVVWVTYSIKFKVGWNYDGSLMANTWQARPLNQGYMFRTAIGAKPQIARDVRGNPIKVNLDSNGMKLLDGSGNNLVQYGNITLPGISPAAVLFDSTEVPGPSLTPLPEDVGATFQILGGAGWTVGAYPVVAVATIGGVPQWVVSGNPSSTNNGNGQFIINRQPQYLYFNRAYTADFNALSLGPF